MKQWKLRFMIKTKNLLHTLLMMLRLYISRVDELLHMSTERKFMGGMVNIWGGMLNGIIYDLKGFGVGFTYDIYPVVTYIKSIKHVRQIPYIRPMFKLGYSDKDLGDFLEGGNYEETMNWGRHSCGCFSDCLYIQVNKRA